MTKRKARRERAKTDAYYMKWARWDLAHRGRLAALRTIRKWLKEVGCTYELERAKNVLQDIRDNKWWTRPEIIEARVSSRRH